MHQTLLTDDPVTLTLDAQALGQIRNARLRHKRVDRVASVAAFNAWSAAIIGAMSIAVGLVDPTLVTILAAMVLIAVAVIEFKGRTMVRHFNERGLVLLACNQLFLGICIILYAIWQLVRVAHGQGTHLQNLQAAGDVGQQIADMTQTISLLVYWVLIFGTMLFQGGMAVFYLASRKVVRAFLHNTEPWVIAILRAVE